MYVFVYIRQSFFDGTLLFVHFFDKSIKIFLSAFIYELSFQWQ